MGFMKWVGSFLFGLIGLLVLIIGAKASFQIIDLALKGSSAHGIVTDLKK